MAGHSEVMDMQKQAVLLTKLAKVACICIEKVDGKPTSAITDSDRAALSGCVERYFDSEQFLLERLQAKARQMQEQAAKGAH